MKNAVHSVANSNRHLDRSSDLNGMFLFTLFLLTKSAKDVVLKLKLQDPFFLKNILVFSVQCNCSLREDLLEISPTVD